MKRFLVLLLIFILLLSGCKQTSSINEGVVDTPVSDDLEIVYDKTDESIPNPEPDHQSTEVSDEETVTCTAIVRDISETSFLASCTDKTSGRLFYCYPGENTQWSNAAGLHELQQGDILKIVFDGCMDESYPCGLHRPYSIEKVSNSLELYLEQELKHVEKMLRGEKAEQFFVQVWIKEFPGYDYSFNTPMDPKPDFSDVYLSYCLEERYNNSPPEIDGGTRFLRSFEMNVPGGTSRDVLGSIKKLMGMDFVLEAHVTGFKPIEE